MKKKISTKVKPQNDVQTPQTSLATSDLTDIELEVLGSFISMVNAVLAKQADAIESSIDMTFENHKGIFELQMVFGKMIASNFGKH